MDTKTFTTTIVGLVILVLVISTVTIPVVQDTQSEFRTEQNNTGYLYAVANSATTIELETTGGTVTVNGMPMTQNRAMAVFSEEFQVMKYSTVYVVLTETGSFTVSEATISNGTFSYTTTDSVEGSFTYDATKPVYYNAVSGEYGLFDTTTANIPKNAVLYCFTDRDFKDASNNTLRLQVTYSGTLEDGFDIIAHTTGGVIQVYTDGSVDVAYTDHGTYNTVSATPPTITVDVSGVDYTAGGSTGSGVVKWQYFAPISYEIISPSDQNMINLFELIPMLMILGVLLIAVRMLGARN